MKNKEYRTQGYTPSGVNCSGRIRINNIDLDKNLNINHTSYKKRGPQNIRFNKKKLVAVFLTGAILFGSYTVGVKAVNLIKGNYYNHVVGDMATHTITYSVSSEENLWNIVSKYKKDAGDIKIEISNICLKNNIKQASHIHAGQVIKIDVPYDSLEEFGYTLIMKEPSKWEKQEYFLGQVFKDIKPDSYMHGSYKAIYVGEEDSPSIMTQITSKMIELKDLQLTNKGIDKESITIIAKEIDDLYDKAVFIAQRLTNKEYGKDYVLNSIPMVIENKPINNKEKSK